MCVLVQKSLVHWPAYQVRLGPLDRDWEPLPSKAEVQREFLESGRVSCHVTFLPMTKDCASGRCRCRDTSMWCSFSWSILVLLFWSCTGFCTPQLVPSLRAIFAHPGRKDPNRGLPTACPKLKGLFLTMLKACSASKYSYGYPIMRLILQVQQVVTFRAVGRWCWPVGSQRVYFCISSTAAGNTTAGSM